MMHILILGASGRVGIHILTYALQEGHHVTVLVRSPEKINPHPNLRIIQGNVLHPEDLKRAVQGAEAVISALNTDGTTTLSESIPLIIDAMAARRHTANRYHRNGRNSAEQNRAGEASLSIQRIQT